MLYYNRTDINEGVDRTESNRNKKWMFCQWWFFKCNCCHDLTTLCLNVSKITIIAVKNVDYCCIIHNIFLFFCFAIYKMVYNEHSMVIYKSVKICIGTVMENLEMWKIVPDQFKAKTMCKHPVKNLPFVIRYVPDQYKT